MVTVESHAEVSWAGAWWWRNEISTSWGVREDNYLKQVLTPTPPNWENILGWDILGGCELSCGENQDISHKVWGKINSWHADMSNWCLPGCSRLTVIWDWRDWRDWGSSKSPPHWTAWCWCWSSLSLTSPCFLDNLWWPPPYCVHCRHWTRTEPQLCCSDHTLLELQSYTPLSQSDGLQN